MNRIEVVEKVEALTRWWIGERAKKISALQHATMEINPFLAPIICALHGLQSAEQLADFVTAGHFYIGHGTGFGKLVDEKILPQAFKTEKLSKSYRARHNLLNPAFDDIDHIVRRADGVYLLSQKASKWTIQLGQAIGLNRSFADLIAMRSAGQFEFKKIIVGVFYGHADDLTDKYRVLRGITTGADHKVVNISADVEVKAGKDFWAWLAGEPEAQSWIMSGIIAAINGMPKTEQKAQHATDIIEKKLTGSLAKITAVNDESG